MLSSVQSLKQFLEVDSADVTNDDKLSQALAASDAAIKNYVKRGLEAAVLVEYPLLRNGAEALVLNETPVLSYRLTGNIISGQPTITGLSSTAGLLVGMPALQALSINNSPTTQPFPNNAVIGSVDSSSQVTMTANATATLTGIPFIFGLAVWLDMAGDYGDGIGSDPTGPFGPSTLLYAGRDYTLQRDQPDGTSKSGKLTIKGYPFGGLGTGWGFDMGGAYGMYGLGAGMGMQGPLSTRTRPQWPAYPPGCVKVVYAGGYTAIPADLTQACNQLAAWFFENDDAGGLQKQSESFQGYNASVAQAVDWLKSEGALGETRRILSRYRRVPI